MILKRSLLLVLLCYPFISHSTVDHDFASWNGITITGPLSGKFRYWLEAQMRFGMDVNQLSQSIIRPGIGYQIDKQNSLWLGYARIYTAEPFTTNPHHENRFWQQYLGIYHYAVWTGLARSRLEQRWLQNRSDIGWRYRQFLGLRYPFLSHPNFYATTTDEVFINLNNTATTGSNQGYNQNRWFAGIGYHPSKIWRIELGYLNHHIHRIHQTNYYGNYIALNLFANIP